MVLLDVLHRLAGKHQWRLTVAHFNHQLRGRSSGADERLVARTAKSLKLPVVVGRSKVREFAQKNKLSLEMASRQLRHQFLARTASRGKIESIALAHHADDQVELFFLRLFRGVGAEGLAGMKWRSASPANPQIELVRPLLDLPKAALLEYARERHVSFREDESNLCLDFRRNRIRHELLPLLKRNYQPSLDKVIPRLIELIGAEAEAVGELALNWLKVRSPAMNANVGQCVSPAPPKRHDAKGAGETHCPTLGFMERAGERGRFNYIATAKGGTPNFDRLPVALQRRCVQLQLIAHGIAPEFELVEQLRLKSGQAVNLRGGTEGTASVLRAVRDETGLVHLHQRKPTEFLPGAVKLTLTGKRRTAVFDGVRIGWEFRSEALERGHSCPQQIATNAGPPKLPKTREKGQVFAQNSGYEWFDAEKVGSRMVLRHWRPGDRFQPIGMQSAVKLQDFFVNQKVPRQRRRELVLAATAQGEVLWVEGQRISERFKITENTNRRLFWVWRRSAPRRP
jgi:tRNA(Ile)-lysidine synthase